VAAPDQGDLLGGWKPTPGAGPVECHPVVQRRRRRRAGRSPGASAAAGAPRSRFSGGTARSSGGRMPCCSTTARTARDGRRTSTPAARKAGQERARAARSRAPPRSARFRSMFRFHLQGRRCTRRIARPQRGPAVPAFRRIQCRPSTTNSTDEFLAVRRDPRARGTEPQDHQDSSRRGHVPGPLQTVRVRTAEPPGIRLAVISGFQAHFSGPPNISWETHDDAGKKTGAEATRKPAGWVPLVGPSTMAPAHRQGPKPGSRRCPAAGRRWCGRTARTTRVRTQPSGMPEGRSKLDGGADRGERGVRGFVTDQGRGGRPLQRAQFPRLSPAARVAAPPRARRNACAGPRRRPAGWSGVPLPGLVVPRPCGPPDGMRSSGVARTGKPGIGPRPAAQANKLHDPGAHPSVLTIFNIMPGQGAFRQARPLIRGDPRPGVSFQLRRRRRFLLQVGGRAGGPGSAGSTGSGPEAQASDDLVVRGDARAFFGGLPATRRVAIQVGDRAPRQEPRSVPASHQVDQRLGVAVVDVVSGSARPSMLPAPRNAEAEQTKRDAGGSARRPKSRADASQRTRAPRSSRPKRRQRPKPRWNVAGAPARRRRASSQRYANEAKRDASRTERPRTRRATAVRGQMPRRRRCSARKGRSGGRARRPRQQDDKRKAEVRARTGAEKMMQDAKQQLATLDKKAAAQQQLEDKGRGPQSAAAQARRGKRAREKCVPRHSANPPNAPLPRTRPPSRPQLARRTARSHRISRESLVGRGPRARGKSA